MFTGLLDLALSFLVIYGALRLLRQRRSVPQALGLSAFVLASQFLLYFKLSVFGVVPRAVLSFLPFIVVVLFQSDIKQGLNYLGGTLRRVAHLGAPWKRQARRAFDGSLFDTVVLAATTMSSTHTGALIVFERDVSLRHIADMGVPLDAEFSYSLILSIFHPATPLHDGAVIVRDGRAAAASCFFGISTNPLLTKDLGTRHRAAIGITEDTDAVVVVVSEETGIISFTRDGQIRRHLDAARLRAELLEAFEPSPPEAVWPERGEVEAALIEGGDSEASGK